MAEGNKLIALEFYYTKSIENHPNFKKYEFLLKMIEEENCNVDCCAQDMLASNWRTKNQIVERIRFRPKFSLYDWLTNLKNCAREVYRLTLGFFNKARHWTWNLELLLYVHGNHLTRIPMFSKKINKCSLIWLIYFWFHLFDPQFSTSLSTYEKLLSSNFYTKKIQ